ncbi:MAG TPA: tRNA (N6-isopentenyl adenosine(37)-C2)-methylthiotransferase MiaB [Deinococcales bacterium]|nr:tRNA (N6-isopentenyl adenosine(37)-C2)-methylthiotransferase MiaB [Deinococcales bacterium]
MSTLQQHPAGGRHLRFSILTYGCQMNEYDTNTIQSELVSAGHMPVDSVHDAELVVLNTCAVRGKPVEKVVTVLGELRKERRQGRDLTIALMGCLAQLDEGKEIADRLGVDILIGPGAITDIVPAVAALEGGAGDYESLEFKDDLVTHITPASGSLTGFLTIMRGCNHHCTYCIVPSTRGPEVSRPLEAILQEAEAMRQAGTEELYLLGQNVNSYGLGNPSLPSFAELLRKVAHVGIPRVKFTTSHPMNFTSDIIDAIAEEDNVCNFIHLPVQSGSDRVLRRMGREYRRDAYLRIIDEIRNKVDNVVISTDIIVGFPGETEDDFEATLSLYEEVAYEQAYMFMYSARPGTPSAKHFEDMPREVKTERLQRLIERQKHWSLVKNRELVGSTLRVLIKDIANEGDYLFGHSDQNHTVLIPKGQSNRLGLMDVVIESATPHTLYGSVKDHEADSVPLLMAA